METIETLRRDIRTAIDCANIYRRRRRDLAARQINHAKQLRDRLNEKLLATGNYVAF